MEQKFMYYYVAVATTFSILFASNIYHSRVRHNLSIQIYLCQAVAEKFKYILRTCGDLCEIDILFSPVVMDNWVQVSGLKYRLEFQKIRMDTNLHTKQICP